MPGILERHQDLFELDYQQDYSLCHCVSEDLAMGKGIAVLFRDRFGGIGTLRSQNRRVGEVASLRSGNCVIYYLITKSKYWDKPSYSDLERCLVQLRMDMRDRGLSKVAMPKIGCGLDGLQWERVRAMIKNVFAGSSIDILVCIK